MDYTYENIINDSDDLKGGNIDNTVYHLEQIHNKHDLTPDWDMTIDEVNNFLQDKFVNIEERFPPAMMYKDPENEEIEIPEQGIVFKKRPNFLLKEPFVTSVDDITVVGPRAAALTPEGKFIADTHDFDPYD